MSKKHIIKSAGVIGFATVISRILGFLRDILIAKFFGTARYAQAFVVAFRIPNMLRDLIGEGAANAAFVPVLSEYSETRKKEEFWHLANVLLNVMFIVLAFVILLGVIFAPIIVRLIAPGFMDDPEKFKITVYLTRLLFPYVLLVGLLAYCMGILNSLKHFSAPAFAPAILNLFIIICALLRQGSVMALAIGVLVGGIIQLLVQVPVLYKKGFTLFQTSRLVKGEQKFGAGHGFNPPSRNSASARFSQRRSKENDFAPVKAWGFNFLSGIYHPAVKKIGRLLVPRILGSCVYQINIFINTMLASFSSIVGEGGVAALYYANRIFQFPLAIFGIALAQAALPTMSREALESGLGNLKKTLSFSIRAVNFIMLPASVGLLVLSEPITNMLFERGMFDHYSTIITAQALSLYSIGLFSYAGIKILVSCFYSLNDTLTPVKVASVSLILNIILSIIFMFPLKISGLALATSFSGIFNFFFLFFILRKKIGTIDGVRILRSFLKVFMASIVMAVIIYFSIFKVGLNLFIVISLGIFSYGTAAVIFDVKEAKEFLKWALRINYPPSCIKLSK
ncbi:MAG: murein biosynthesis integral membrane protein MurJ [Candidatus Omnitrophica bacterium]|nr:murein biosynthesis integral membrane protein MurJ [Candidatus Omnitrophota bacterium]